MYHAMTVNTAVNVRAVNQTRAKAILLKFLLVTKVLVTTVKMIHIAVVLMQSALIEALGTIVNVTTGTTAMDLAVSESVICSLLSVMSRLGSQLQLIKSAKVRSIECCRKMTVEFSSIQWTISTRTMLTSFHRLMKSRKNANFLRKERLHCLLAIAVVRYTRCQQIQTIRHTRHTPTIVC